MKNKVIAFLIFAIGGMSTWFLFLNQPHLLARSQALGTIPLPLVFDSPKGYEFWANKYELHITLENEEIIVKMDKDFYKKFPGNVIAFNSLIIPMVFIPIQEKYNWYPVAEKLFCHPDSPLLKKLPVQNQTIKSVNVFIYNQKENWQGRVKCI